MKIKNVHIEMVVAQDASQRQQIRAIGIVTMAQNDGGRTTQSEQQPTLMLPPVPVSKVERYIAVQKITLGGDRFLRACLP